MTVASPFNPTPCILSPCAPGKTNLLKLPPVKISSQQSQLLARISFHARADSLWAPAVRKSAWQQLPLTTSRSTPAAPAMAPGLPFATTCDGRCRYRAYSGAEFRHHLQPFRRYAHLADFGWPRNCSLRSRTLPPARCCNYSAHHRQ